MKTSKPLFCVLVLAVLFTLPFYTGVYVLNVMDIILIYMALALSWDMLLRSGQISFGMAGLKYAASGAANRRSSAVSSASVRR